MYAAKAWLAAIGTIVGALAASFADDVFSTSEIANVIATVIAVIGTLIAVYQVKNKPDPDADKEAETLRQGW